MQETLASKGNFHPVSLRDTIFCSWNDTGSDLDMYDSSLKHCIFCGHKYGAFPKLF